MSQNADNYVTRRAATIATTSCRQIDQAKAEAAAYDEWMCVDLEALLQATQAIQGQLGATMRHAVSTLIRSRADLQRRIDG